MAFLLSLILLASGFCGALLGGVWSFLPVLLISAAIPLMDLLVPPSGNRATRISPTWFDLLLYAFFALYFLLLISVCKKIASPQTTGVEWLGITLSMGILSGALGFTYAHEMIHRPHLRWMGEAIFVALWYGQYAISHLQCHHRFVGTRLDPMTARRGQSLYAFWIQAIPGSMRFSWRTDRLRSIVYLAASCALTIAVFVYGGWLTLAFFLAQAVVAILLSVGGDYIEHYGLARTETSPGRFVAIAAQHSWNSPLWCSGVTLLHLQRHSDHHLHAARPYQNLELIAGAPQLPASFPTMIFLAFFPPLYRRVMETHLTTE